MRKNRIPIMMYDDELKAIDDWRLGNRFATRSGAIRFLCKTALVLAEHNEADRQKWLSSLRTETAQKQPSPIEASVNETATDGAQ